MNGTSIEATSDKIPSELKLPVETTPLAGVENLLRVSVVRGSHCQSTGPSLLIFLPDSSSALAPS